MAEPEKHERKAWDADTMGYGKHEYHLIDPETINVNEFARSMNGEEKHFGDVRQYNSAYNEKHPENDVDLDWLGRVGTIFTTKAKGIEGTWFVTNMPVVRAPSVFARCVRIENEDDDPTGREEVEINTRDLGCIVNDENLYEQIVTKLVKKGSVTRKQRIKLTKKN